MKHFEYEDYETFRCKLCEQIFNSYQELLQHEQTNHGQRLVDIAQVKQKTRFK
jgi:hypothetical protein